MKNLSIKNYFIIALLIFTVFSFANATFVEDTESILPGISDGSATFCDYNNDGWLDLIISGWGADDYGISELWKNDGTGKFIKDTGTTLPGLDDSSVDFGDYNNDGWLDLIISGSSDFFKISQLWKNDGTGKFTKDTGTTLPGVQLNSVAFGDYTNDGWLDLIITGFNGSVSISELWKNDGTGKFTKDTGTILTGVQYSSVAFGDYTNDGWLDLIITGWSSSPTSELWKNDGTGKFIKDTRTILTGVASSSVAFGDYNNDGWLDLIISGSIGAGNKVCELWKNDRTGKFTKDTETTLPGIQFCSVAFGDYSNDGWLDLIISGKSGSSELWKNDGTGKFTKDTSTILPSVFYSSTAFGDYNNDGAIDLIISGDNNSTGIVKLYKNQEISNVAPTPPTILNSSYVNGKLILQWNEGSDNNTPDSSLTYNIRIGTKPNTYNICSGVCPPKFGQKWAVNFDTLIIPQRTYFWSVQAVDNGLMKSEWSAEQIYNAPPIIENITLLSDTNFVGPYPIKATVIDYDISQVVLKYKDTLDYVEIYMKDDGMHNDGVAGDNIYGASIPQQNFGSKVSYYVYAVDSKGQSDTTSIITFRVCQFIEDKSSLLMGVVVGSTSFGDYDNDGDIDIVITGRNASSQYISKLYQNNGNRVFTEDTRSSLIGVVNGSTDFGDYDNDGDLDLLITGYTGTSNSTKLYNNNGTGVFTNSGVFLPGAQNSDADFGDYDNDGDLDIIIVGQGAGSVLYKNNGNGTFTIDAISSLVPDVSYASTAFGDYNNDGNLDFIITGTGTSVIAELYKNTGNGTFVKDTTSILTGVYEGSSTFGDYDNDGDLDLVITGKSGANNFTKLYKNSGYPDFTFAEDTTSSLVDVHYSSTAFGDYNNDGYLDLLITGQIGTSPKITVLYKNSGSPNFTFIQDTTVALTNMQEGKGIFGDYDNDGDLDILTVGTSTGTNCLAKLYKNGEPNTNTPPNPPDVFNSEITLNKLILSWNDGTDDNTPDSSLTYNIRVGTTPGGSDVYSETNPPIMGRNGLINFDTLNINFAKYYWAVQSVDNGLAKSDWSAEQETNTIGIVTGKVKDSETGKPINNATINATIITKKNPLISSFTKEELMGYFTAKSDEYGDFSFIVLGNNNYTINILANGYPNTFSTSVFVPVDTTLNLSAALISPTTPSIPTGLNANPSDNSVLLSWNANPEKNVKGYNIYRRQASTSYNFSVPINSSIVNGTTYQDKGLVNDTTYYYVIKAYNLSDSASIESAEIFATPKDLPPLPVSRLTPTLFDNGVVRLDWIKSPSPDVDKYLIYWDSTGTGAIDYTVGKEIGVVSVDSTTFTITLTPNQYYSFGIRVKDITGNIEQNTNVVVTVVPVSNINGVIKTMIAEPFAGKKICGSSVTIQADLLLGDYSQVKSVKFEYKPYNQSQWNPIPVSIANQTNPDTSYPYFIHWDISNSTVTPAGDYDLRAVVVDTGETTDLMQMYIRLSTKLEPTNSDGYEWTNSVIEHRKIEKVFSERDNSIVIGNEGMNGITVVNLPDGVLSQDTKLDVTIMDPSKNQDILTVEGKNILANVQSAFAGGLHKFELLSGQTNFNDTVDIFIPFKDDDNNDTLDGTNINVNNLRIYTYSSSGGAGQWVPVVSSVNNKTNRLHGQITHFSIFALFDSTKMITSVNKSSIVNRQSSIPVAYYLSQNYPNPFNPETIIRYAVVRDGGQRTGDELFVSRLSSLVTLKIYNITGQLVRTLVNEPQKPGYYTVKWDGRNDNGKELPSGIYIYKLQVNEFTSTKRMIMIK